MMGTYLTTRALFGACFGGGFYVHDMVERGVGLIWMDRNLDIQVKHRIRHITNNTRVVIQHH